MNYMETYRSWLNNAYFDGATHNELTYIQNNPKEIEDRFSKDLSFGTGGLRGIMGAGTNRMNRYTVRKASQGFTEYIANIGENAKERGVVIAYDSRGNSAVFALEAALVFAANGMKAFLFDELRPTPMLSFAVRFLHAAGGIVITASHNPKEYNGYKVYGEDGAQLVPSGTDAVAKEIKKIGDITRIAVMDEAQALKAGLLIRIGKEIDDAYCTELKTLAVSRDVVDQYADKLKIIYTPLHGTGNEPVMRILRELGYENVQAVKEQQEPDASFSSLRMPPNPEEDGVFHLALRLARKDDADIVLATDPDCDRVGVMAKKVRGRYVRLSCNQVGILMLDYLLSQMKEQNRLPENGVILKTIVTTGMAEDIGRYYGVKTVDVLTGFKYIGEKVRELDELGDKKFLFGMEDSCGYLTGTQVRDKDGVIGCMMMAEVAAYYKSRGMTLPGALHMLYEKYGYYLSDLASTELKNEKEAKRINALLMKNDASGLFAELRPVAVRNYFMQYRHDLVCGEITVLGLPRSSVLFVELADGSWFCIRPSGTEPKLKIYAESRGITYKAAGKRLNEIKKMVLRKIRTMI